MLGLPKSSEMCKQLPKKALYAKFHIDNASKARIDTDIARMTLIHELSPSRIRIEAGKTVQSVYVLLVTLKRKEYDKRTISTVAGLIPQNIIFLLEYGGEARLAVRYLKLMETAWQSGDTLTLSVRGLNFDEVWENFICQIGHIERHGGRTLAEQIRADEEQHRIQAEIARLEKKARAENQPKKKLELVKEIRQLKNEAK